MSTHKGFRLALVMVITLIVLVLLSVLAARQSATQGPAVLLDDQQLRSLQLLDKQPPSRRSLEVQQWQTAEGAHVLFMPAPQLPMFDLRLTFAAGSSHDDIPGIAALTNAMLNEGVAELDADAIAEGFEQLGAEFGNGAYRDMAVLSLRSLSAEEQRRPALDLFCQVIGQPSFPEDALKRIKNQLQAGFELQKQNPGKLASLELFERLYGEHPYAHPSEGSAESIELLSREQLIAFHNKAYTAANAVIALVGDLSLEQAKAITAQVSAVLPKGPALARIGQPQTPKAGVSHIEYPSAQTHLILASLGIDRRDPDYAALSVGNQIFGGGGFGTRLMTEVRERRGLTYGVYSGFSAMQARGPFSISLQTRAELSQGTLELIQQMLADYLANGPTEEELEQAKREILGSFPLSTASNADIVGQLGSMGFYDLPLSYLDDYLADVQNLSTEQVREAMARHLNAEQLVIVSAGPTVEQQPLPAPIDRPAEQPAGPPEH